MPVAIRSALLTSTPSALFRRARRKGQFWNNSLARFSWFVPKTLPGLQKPSMIATKAAHQPSLPPSTPSMLFRRARRKGQFWNNLLAGCRWFVPKILPGLRKPSRIATKAPLQPLPPATRSFVDIKITNFLFNFENLDSRRNAVSDACLPQGRRYTLGISIPSPHRSLGSDRLMHGAKIAMMSRKQC